MGRIERSFALGKASWRVLRANHALFLVAVLAFVGAVVVGGVFALLAWMVGGGDGGELESSPAVWLVVALGYVAGAFVTTYCTAALVVGADTALAGGTATVADSLAGANRKLHRLLPWAVLVATVSILLRAVERNGIVGQIVSGLLGLAWSVLTFLAVPVIVLEDVGVGRTLGRSRELLSRTWGENLLGQLGLGAFSLVLFLPAVVVAVLAVASGVGAVAVAGLAVAGLWAVVVSVAVSALSGIYRTALYRYAVDGAVPGAFAGVGIEDAFRSRGGRGLFGS